MARVRLSKPEIWLQKYIMIAAAFTVGFILTDTAVAQTVVIGGSGSSPIEVNMRAVTPAAPYSSRPTSIYQTTPNRLPVYQDYSKSSRIVYGNEVITLVPPGSKPKKKAVTVAVSKKSTPKKTASLKKAASKNSIPAKKPTKTKKQIAVVKAPKAKVKTLVAEPLKAEIKKKSVPAAPPQKVAKVEDTAAKKEKALVKAENLTPTQPEQKTTEAKKPQIPVKQVEKKESVVASKPKAITKTPLKPVETGSMAKPKKEIQVAAVSPETAKKPNQQLAPAMGKQNQIFFELEQTKLPGSAVQQLKTLADSLISGNDRIQLVAYAEANSNSAARRLSLGRALVVRSKLMELGVPNNKIEVRALGKPKDGSPADRVDLKLITR